MALIQCPECGAEISYQAQACIKCGHSMQPSAKKKQYTKCKISVFEINAVLGGAVNGDK